MVDDFPEPDSPTFAREGITRVEAAERMDDPALLVKEHLPTFFITVLRALTV